MGTASQLLLRASSAQMARLLRKVWVRVIQSQSLVMLVSLFKEVGALIARLELSSLTASQLLLSASSAQLARLLRKVRVRVIQSLVMLVSLFKEVGALIALQAPHLRGALRPSARLLWRAALILLRLILILRPTR